MRGSRGEIEPVSRVRVQGGITACIEHRAEDLNRCSLCGLEAGQRLPTPEQWTLCEYVLLGTDIRETFHSSDSKAAGEGSVSLARLMKGKDIQLRGGTT